MPVNPSDKPIARLREETVDQLILNYSHGEISLEAFERRLDEALDAKTHDALLSLTKDLDLVVDEAFMARKKRNSGSMADTDSDMNGPGLFSFFGSTVRQGSWNVPEIIKAFREKLLEVSETVKAAFA